MEQTAIQKPRLRGVSHEIAFYVSIVAVGLLVLAAPNARAGAASAIYGVTLATLFGISALYHRPTWSPGPRQLMRRLDHAAIFLLIAGTYTPLFWLADGPASGYRALWTVWIGAALGVAQSLVWPNAPKAVTAALCLALGWGVVGDVVRLRSIVDGTTIWLLVIGGVIYSAGAIVYARRRPDPAPRVFGYHEIFHALVVVAGACHFAHVARIVRAGG